MCSFRLDLEKDFFLELWLVYLVVSKPHHLFDVLAELLECVCVELEGSGVHPVRLTMRRGIERVHKWLGVLLFSLLWVALLPSECLWCRENKIAIKFVTPACRGGWNTPLTDRHLGGNLGDVGSRVTPIMRTQRCCKHPT